MDKKVSYGLLILAACMVMSMFGCAMALTLLWVVTEEEPSAETWHITGPITAQNEPPPLPEDGMDWNDVQIKWWPYQEGLAEARAKSLPVLVLQYATWCSDCTALAPVFDDPRLVALSRRIVMVRVDSDLDDVGEQFPSSINYIPSVVFLDSSGRPLPLVVDPYNPDDEYAYFYSDWDTKILLSNMKRAIEHERASQTTPLQEP